MSKLYWRCVWANKFSLAAYCLFGLVGTIEIVRQTVELGPTFVNGLAYPGPGYFAVAMEIFGCAIGFMLGVATALGQDTMRQYHRTMRILIARHDASISASASYCYRIGHELALRDFASKRHT